MKKLRRGALEGVTYSLANIPGNINEVDFVVLTIFLIKDPFNS
jgi:hypothetical protein